MEQFDRISYLVGRLLIGSCGCHELLTMGRSDRCEGSMGPDSAHSSGTLSCHQQITQTAENHEFFLLMGVSVRKFYGMVSDICFEIIRDSCDGSGLNTIASSKGSPP